MNNFYLKNHEKNNTKLIELLKSIWDNLHSRNVFRYKITNLQERLIEGKYLLQLNPDRSTNRRAPEQIDNICQPFNKNKFNFTKVNPEEIMFNIIKDETDGNMHSVIINASPISPYHSLLVPYLNQELPQVVTAESIELVLHVMLIAQDRNLRIGFNSLCAMASVNHLHYHLFIESNDLAVEKEQCELIQGPLYYLSRHQVPAFCFQLQRFEHHRIHEISKEIFKLTEYLLKKSVAHNIFITRGLSVLGNHDNEVLRILVWPRKSSSGAKQLAAFNIAVCELSGWFPVYNSQSFNNLTIEELNNELCKWKLDKFDELCLELKDLYS